MSHLAPSGAFMTNEVFPQYLVSKPSSKLTRERESERSIRLVLQLIIHEFF